MRIIHLAVKQLSLILCGVPGNKPLPYELFTYLKKIPLSMSGIFILYGIPYLIVTLFIC